MLLFHHHSLCIVIFLGGEFITIFRIFLSIDKYRKLDFHVTYTCATRLVSYLCQKYNILITTFSCFAVSMLVLIGMYVEFTFTETGQIRKCTHEWI